MEDFRIFFSVSLAIFLLMDPLGNIPVYIAILQELPVKKQRAIILREKIIALAIICLFALLGNYLLAVLHVSNATLYFAGGIILFLIAIKMIFPGSRPLRETFGEGGEPFIFPLAVPLIAGPSVLAAVMIYSAQGIYWPMLLLAIFLAWIGSTCILLGAPLIKRFLGQRGISALERLMGLVLTLLAIQMFLNGFDRYGI